MIKIKMSVNTLGCQEEGSEVFCNPGSGCESALALADVVFDATGQRLVRDWDKSLHEEVMQAVKNSVAGLKGTFVSANETQIIFITSEVI